MIDEYRWKRLVKHLERVERQIGDLDESIEGSDISCPIIRLTPLRDRGGMRFCSCTGDGRLGYQLLGTSRRKHYKIYTKEDSKWWLSLDDEGYEAYEYKLQEWLKERNNAEIHTKRNT